MQDSVERFLNALETEREFSANTVSAYRNDLKQFVTYLQAELSLHSWPEVQCTHLTSYTLEMREREYAVSTIARKTAAVKSFFGYLTESGELRADPSASLASPRVEKYIPRAITENEMAMLLGEPMRNSTPEAVRDFAMLHVLYSTGMRVSELMRLDIDDVDAACQRVRCTGKQGRTCRRT